MDSVSAWYNNPDSDDNGFPDLITGTEVNELVGESQFGYTASSFPQQTGFINLQGQTVNNISYAEMQMAIMEQQCVSACQQRKQTIIQMLTDTLTARCYIIGGCKTSSDYVTDNVIPQADFDAIVDSIIGQCSSMCTVNTYKCIPPVTCRMVQTSKLDLGDNSSIVSLELGTGGTPSDACTIVTGQDYYDCSQAADSSLSFCQYTKVQQASNWNMEIDLPSACSATKGAKVLSCQPGNTTCVPRSAYQAPEGVAAGPPAAVSGAVPLEVSVSK